MLDTKPVTTLIGLNVILLKQAIAADSHASLLYATAIGSLMYTAIGMQLDISYVV